MEIRIEPFWAKTVTDIIRRPVSSGASLNRFYLRTISWRFDPWVRLWAYW